MRDREIKVLAGYHEWNIFVDDEFLYSLGDITEDIDFFDSPKDFANDVVDSLFEEAKDLYYNGDYKMLETLRSFTINEKKQLNTGLKNAFRYYMG